jgi:uncharacterized membrane protein YfcA
MISKNNQNMTTSVIIILAIIGIFTGVMAGMLGIGGAVIMVPALVYLLGLSQQSAQGTSLAVMLPPIGVIAAWNYYKAGHVNIKFALILAVCFIAGSYFGSRLSLNLSESVLKKIFAVLLLAIAAKMLISR